MKYAFLFIISFLTLLQACAPKDPVVFKGIRNIQVIADDKGNPQLSADVDFYNPNKVKSKLKEISVDILVDGKKSGEVRQQMELPITSKSDFSVPVVANLSFKELGLLDAVLGFFGGKKYDVVFSGYIKIVVHGVPVKVPVMQKQQVKLNM